MAGQYFYKKISKAVTEDRIIEDFDLLLGNSISRSSFNSSEDLQKYLTEGAMLNVNSFGSKILSIPSGEYLVWLTDAGHTMLVPASDSQKTKEVFENARASYEVFTNDLLKSFIGVEKTLTEAENKDDAKGDEDEKEKEDDDKDKDISFTLNVDRSDVDRTSKIFSAIPKGRSGSIGTKPSLSPLHNISRIFVPLICVVLERGTPNFLMVVPKLPGYCFNITSSG